MTVQQQIEELSRRRHEAWERGDSVAELTAQITKLYDERRRDEVQAVHGPPDAIIKRARIESELERLWGDKSLTDTTSPL